MIFLIIVVIFAAVTGILLGVFEPKQWILRFLEYTCLYFLNAVPDSER